MRPLVMSILRKSAWSGWAHDGRVCTEDGPEGDWGASLRLGKRVERAPRPRALLALVNRLVVASSVGSATCSRNGAMRRRRPLPPFRPSHIDSEERSGREQPPDFERDPVTPAAPRGRSRPSLSPTMFRTMWASVWAMRKTCFDPAATTSRTALTASPLSAAGCRCGPSPVRASSSSRSRQGATLRVAPAVPRGCGPDEPFVEPVTWRLRDGPGRPARPDTTAGGSRQDAPSAHGPVPAGFATCSPRRTACLAARKQWT